jgi:uncharacterized protein (TIGR02246 family)
MRDSYLKAVEDGNLDAFAFNFAEDAVRLEDGINMIHGREAIREHFRPLFENADLKITLYGEQEIQISGDLAFGHANFIVTSFPLGSDTLIHTDYKFLEVYKLQDDGSWKIQAASALTNPPWTGDVRLEDLIKTEDRSVPRL